jgi:hypothetical protein
MRGGLLELVEKAFDAIHQAIANACMRQERQMC